MLGLTNKSAQRKMDRAVETHSWETLMSWTGGLAGHRITEVASQCRCCKSAMRFLKGSGKEIYTIDAQRPCTGTTVRFGGR